MNFLLFILLIAAGEVAYFETTVQQQTNDGFQEQETAWQHEDDSLRDENQQLVSTKNDLLKDIASVQAGIDSMTNKQPNNGNADAGMNAGAAPAGQPAALTTSLGTISTIDGQKFKQCHLLKVEADGITFSHSLGITKIMYANLPQEMLKTYDVDAQTGAASQAAQDRYQALIQQQAGAGQAQ